MALIWGFSLGLKAALVRVQSRSVSGIGQSHFLASSRNLLRLPVPFRKSLRYGWTESAAFGDGEPHFPAPGVLTHEVILPRSSSGITSPPASTSSNNTQKACILRISV